MLVGSVEATLLVLLLIIVFGPLIAERFRVPGLIGLIAGGMIFGPFVLGWLQLGGLVSDLGAIGILYLMFLAGLSFNLRRFEHILGEIRHEWSNMALDGSQLIFTLSSQVNRCAACVGRDWLG